MISKYKQGKLNRKFYEFRKWFDEDIELYPHLKYLPHSITSITYDPAKRDEIETNGIFDIDNTISDKKKFVELLTPILIKYFGSEYYVRRYYNQIPWIVDEDRKDKRMRKIILYLKRKIIKPTNTFSISRLKPFLDLFITYPTDFWVTPIVLIPISGKGIVLIHEANTVVIGSQDLELMEKFYDYFKSVGITVLTSTDFELPVKN